MRFIYFKLHSEFFNINFFPRHFYKYLQTLPNFPSNKHFFSGNEQTYRSPHIRPINFVLYLRVITNTLCYKAHLQILYLCHDIFSRLTIFHQFPLVKNLFLKINLSQLQPAILCPPVLASRQSMHTRREYRSCVTRTHLPRASLEVTIERKREGKKERGEGKRRGQKGKAKVSLVLATCTRLLESLALSF